MIIRLVTNNQVIFVNNALRLSTLIKKWMRNGGFENLNINNGIVVLIPTSPGILTLVIWFISQLVGKSFCYFINEKVALIQETILLSFYDFDFSNPMVSGFLLASSFKGPLHGTLRRFHLTLCCNG